MAMEYCTVAKIGLNVRLFIPLLNKTCLYDSFVFCRYCISSIVRKLEYICMYGIYDISIYVSCAPVSEFVHYETCKKVVSRNITRLFVPIHTPDARETAAGGEQE